MSAKLCSSFTTSGIRQTLCHSLSWERVSHVIKNNNANLPLNTESIEELTEMTVPMFDVIKEPERDCTRMARTPAVRALPPPTGGNGPDFGY